MTTRLHFVRAAPLAGLVGLALMTGACGPRSTPGDPCDSCEPWQTCEDGQCVDPPDGSVQPDGWVPPDAYVPPDAEACPAEQQCNGGCCREDEYCALGTTCAVAQPTCTTNDDCWFDAYCVSGACVPYGTPVEHDHDPDCENPIDINAILPDVQCRWTGPPTGDAHPDHVHVMSTPMVVDFDFDADPVTLEPSIVFTTFPTAGSYGAPGVIRVISGRDCAQQYSFDETADQAMSPASVAVGDLDGDGHAEIVAAAYGGGILAFRYDPGAQTFTRLWRSGTCPGGIGPPTTPDTTGGADQWGGPSIHDLDDDGEPEIIYGAVVYRADGCLQSSTVGYPVYHKGVIPVIADVDADNKPELILGNALYEWDALAADWVAESYFTGTSLSAGQVAVADMGNFPVAALGNQDGPEIVVISSGYARVQTIEGTIVFGPLALPGGGSGGPPTVADFDGDGQREFATAGGGQYIVFDFDCLVGGDPAGCNGQSPGTGVLWTQPSQDLSSNVTGSSVFDFDADGAAEAVYADECFLRIYEGATGTVLYSAARSSGTTYENPVIADVDGDYRTEIVSAVNDYGALSCPAFDPLLTTSTYTHTHGIVVLRDVEDRWAASRPVWNQHAYAVTHVGDRGEIPPSSAVARNWAFPSLNNFRQNVQGDLDALGEPDLTTGGQVGQVACVGTVATIPARVCNRGTLPMVGGTVVAFYEDDQAGAELCRATIPIALDVGECLEVSCEADLEGQTVDVFVRVDPDEATPECHEANNAALYRNVGCGQIPY